MTLDSHSYQPAHRPHLTNCFPAATGTGGGGCSELCTLKMLRVEWTAVLVAVLALVAAPPPVRTAEVNCTSHTAPVLRDIVVLGQFNSPERLPLPMVMRWVTSWRCLSRQVVVAGPFDGAKLAALQKEVPVLQTAPDRGWVSPYGALARALEMFRHDEAFHGVLYVHDDLLLNSTLLLRLPFDPRQPLFSSKTPRRTAFSSPRHAFEWEGGVADAGHSYWWNHPRVGIPKLRAAWADPRARRFQAADGSFSWWIGQSDMAYVPMRAGGDYIAAAAWLGAHGVFLEIALPSIMMWLEDARGARVQLVPLCTRFHPKCRNCTADMAAFCRGLGAPFGAIHAIKPSTHLPDWEALFDGITLAGARHAACCRVLRNAFGPAPAAAPRPPEPPAAPPSPPKPRPRNALHSLLPPVQVVKQYQQWHSQGSLERAPDNRRFAIGYYSCPREAGNRLHRFFNDLIFAMATNRTLLWKYQDDKFVENTPEDCEQVLGRGAWLPSYAVWAPRLSLGPAVHLHSDNPVPLDATESRVVALPDIRHPWPPFITGNGLRTSPAQERARSLFAEGRWFLYGLLFRETFRFQPAVLPPPPPRGREKHASGPDFSIALHSRHFGVDNDGSNVTHERDCLDRLLAARPPHAQCRVYVMVDRAATLQHLRAFLTSRGCGAVAVSHTAAANHKDNGPFSGAPYIQDLASASRARHALVLSEHSSGSYLLNEIVEYDRAMEGWHTGRYPPRRLPVCVIPTHPAWKR